MEKTILFIDGAYLSFISKHFGEGKPLKYKIEDFAVKFCEKAGLFCETIYYYTAPPFKNPNPTEDEKQGQRNYDRFILKLKSVKPHIIVREGRCQKIDSTYQQKGVDTLMTMDLLKIAEAKKVNTITIITSDTDFVPIIEDIRKGHGLKVTLGYFTDRKRKSAFSLSNYLWKSCDYRILIRREFFES